MKLSAIFRGGKVTKPSTPENSFSANVYDGLSATAIQVQNGVDLATDGGMVIIKKRNTTASASPKLMWTDHGPTKSMVGETTTAMATDTPLQSFNVDGFTVAPSNAFTNGANMSFAAYTFKNADKFFVTKTLVHTVGVADTVDLSSLGSVGMALVVNTSVAQNRMVWHKNLANGVLISWDGANAQASNTLFTISGTTLTINANAAAGTYQISAWADNASEPDGGIIKCGIYTGNGSTTVPVDVLLGWEPQFILIKSITANVGWHAMDATRSIVSYNLSQTSVEYLSQVTAEAMTPMNGVHSRGFSMIGNSTCNGNGIQYIYMAIRRPTTVPKSASDVFNTYLYAGTNTNNRYLGTGIRPDWVLMRRRDLATTGYSGYLSALRSWGTYYIRTGSQEFTLSTSATGLDQQLLSSEWASPMSDKGIYIGNAQGTTATTSVNVNANTVANNHHILAFTRRAGFFETQVFKGTGGTQTVNHGLGAVPQLMLIHDVDQPGNICFYSGYYGPGYIGFMDTGSSLVTGNDWNNTWPTDTQFTVNGNSTNRSGAKYQAILFASCPGVSYIGAYTGTGSAVTVNVPTFTTGVRAVILFGISGSSRWPVFTTATGNTAIYMSSYSNPGESSSTTNVFSGNSFTVTPESGSVSNGFVYGYLAIAN